MINDEKEFLQKHFLRSLAELKYMGVMSTTKQSTFLFKKNVYCKPKIYRTQIAEATEELKNLKFK